MPTRSVRLRVLATLGAGLAVGAVATMVARGTAPAGPVIDPAPTSSTTAPTVGPEELAAAHAYVDAVCPTARQAGQVVQEGMKPAVTRLQDPDGDHEGVAAGAPGWAGAMTRAHEDWAAVTPPPALEDAHALFLRSLTRYTEAARQLGEAATDDDERQSLTMDVIELGTQADEIYDEAAAVLQAHLVAGGDDPAPCFPQPD